MPERRRRSARGAPCYSPYYDEFGVAPGSGGALRLPFDEAMCAIGRRAFGPRSSASISACPIDRLLARVKATGAIVVGNATTVEEARLARAAAAPMPSSPRDSRPAATPAASSASDPAEAMGLFALLPQVADCGAGAGDRGGRYRRRPRDCRRLRARRERGPARHRLSPRARSADQRARIARSSSDGRTVVTNLMTGGLARGLHGRLIDELGPVRDEAPPYPLASEALAPIRKAAESGASSASARCGQGKAAPLGAGASGRRADPQAGRRRAGDPRARRPRRGAWKSSPSPPSPTITSGWSTMRRAAKRRSSIPATPRRCWPKRERRGWTHRPGVEHPLALPTTPAATSPSRKRPARRLRPRGRRPFPARDVGLSEGSEAAHRRARRAGDRGPRPHARPYRPDLRGGRASRSSATPCSRWAAAGCSKGRREQMHRSLQRLAALPAETQLYCAHEYTLANARFAAHAEPGNRGDRARGSARSQRCARRARSPLPTTVARGTCNQSLRSSRRRGGVRAPARGERQLPFMSRRR